MCLFSFHNFILNLLIWVQMDRPGTSKKKITHRNVIPDVFQVETALQHEVHQVEYSDKPTHLQDPIPSDAQHHTEVVYDG